MCSKEQALALLYVLGVYWSVLRRGNVSDEEALHLYPELMGASLAPIGFLNE